MNSKVATPAAPAQLTCLVKAGEGLAFDVGGPRIQFLTLSQEEAYCVMKGIIPGGVSVPLHSHSDAESFHVNSGEAQVLAQTKAGLEWKTLQPGDFVHIPGEAKCGGPLG